MKKIFGWLIILAFCGFLAPMTSAQTTQTRDGHASGHTGGRTSGHVRDNHSAPGHFNGDRGHHMTAADRAHFDGHHFDAGFRSAHFGRGHSFVVGRPVFFNGGYRFFYSGFWFSFDAWPYGWGYSDPCYIDLDGDVYYLYDPLYPGARLSLGVVI